MIYTTESMIPKCHTGEKVYMNNMAKENKLSTNFDPILHTVERSQNGEVTVKYDETGQQYRRNIKHLKKKLKGIGKMY